MYIDHLYNKCQTECTVSDIIDLLNYSLLRESYHFYKENNDDIQNNSIGLYSIVHRPVETSLLQRNWSDKRQPPTR